MNGQSNGIYLLGCILIFLAGVAWSAESLVTTVAEASTAVGTLLLVYFAYTAQKAWFEQKAKEIELQLLQDVVRFYIVHCDLYNLDWTIIQLKDNPSQTMHVQNELETKLNSLCSKRDNLGNNVLDVEAELLITASKLIKNREVYAQVAELVSTLEHPNHSKESFEHFHKVVNNTYRLLQERFVPGETPFDLPKGNS